MVPARMGSQRLTQKNHLEISGRSLVEYSLQLAIDSGVFDKVFLNSESKSFEKYAKNKNVDFHLRPEVLGSSGTPIDAVIYEFMMSHRNAQTVFLINPPAQLLKVKDIADAVLFFNTENLDSLITSTKLYRHSLIDGRPLNFEFDRPLSPTKDLLPIEILNYSIMAWKSVSFIKNYEISGAGLMCGNFKTFENGFTNLLAVKNQEDYQIQKLLRESGLF